MSQPPTPQDNAISQLTHNPEKYRDYLLQMMVTNKASDMYLTFGESPCLRIHGSVHRITQIPVFTDDQLEHLALSLMDERQKKQFVEERDLDLGYSSNGGRYRVNVSHQRRHVLIVIRLLCSKIMTLDELGLPQIFKQIVRRHNGIILMAGATGS
jgi:twitching motility protein PilT